MAETFWVRLEYNLKVPEMRQLWNQFSHFASARSFGALMSYTLRRSE